MNVEWKEPTSTAALLRNSVSHHQNLRKQSYNINIIKYWLSACVILLQQQVGHNKTSLSQKKAPIYFFYYLCNVNFTNVYANAKIYVDGKLRTNTINNNNVLTQTGTGLHSASRISRLLWKDAKWPSQHAPSKTSTATTTRRWHGACLWSSQTRDGYYPRLIGCAISIFNIKSLIMLNFRGLRLQR